MNNHTNAWEDFPGPVKPRPFWHDSSITLTRSSRVGHSSAVTAHGLSPQGEGAAAHQGRECVGHPEGHQEVLAVAVDVVGLVEEAEVCVLLEKPRGAVREVVRPEACCRGRVYRGRERIK